MSKRYSHTHFQAYFLCLLLANTMQAWGTTMSLKWVELRGIVDGAFCAAQGGIVQGGNLGSAFWSFIISWHLFNLLFLRYKTPKIISTGTIVFGWSLVFTLVFLGPVAIQTVARGHYFGISGLWCWITTAYHKEQIYLEYFFQIISVVVNFFMHVVTLMRVRGNLLRVDGRWRLRFVPLGDSWQLSLGRDFTDSTMLRLAQHMIWCIAYAATTLPMGIVRMVEFCGMEVPLWAEALTGIIFNLGGFVNVVLFLGARRFFPDPGLIPEFTERKESREVDAIVAQYGVVPFTLHRAPSASASASEPEPASDLRKSFDSDTASVETVEPAVHHARDFPERISSRRPFSAARPDFPPHR
ncbi:hypothetical protein DFH08DRAFT_706558 [Mycena albidolilacea]|uniref:Glucose receptor Git3 N-terminal domain-containing protein n=1 Tax=Mycena albidolilacea TaxID=1033008 RepID=A0AAD6ZRS8_9AGAR|nr:hypothetical protein DFH08DRAFT_706558 [Mycena albidolilacea]